MRISSITLAASAVPLTSASIAPLRRRTAQSANPANITSTLNGFWFDVEVQVGNQSFQLLVDTGSSDTWVAQNGYLCVGAGNNTSELPQQACLWSPTYDPPPDLEFIANQTFGVQYGTGIALGRVAIESVTLGGITVPRQKVGIVDRTNDIGDGLNSGILGLGYPPLTSAHCGTDAANDSISLLSNRARYDPLFVNMYKQGLVDPWYSLAIERPQRNKSTNPGGWLGLGELPPVRHSNDWAVAPIEITKDIPELYYENDPEITLMTLTVDGITWGLGTNSSRATNSTKFQAVVDSGNYLNMLPLEVAVSVNAAFDPPAVFDDEIGLYIVDCDARAPALGVTIDGHTFWHNGADLISRAMNGTCISTIAPPAEGQGVYLSFLGDAFLRNVVSVFDFGKDEMRFASRIDGQDEAVPPTSGGVYVFPRGEVSWTMASIGLVVYTVANLM